MAEKNLQNGSKTSYKVVGVLTESLKGFANAVEFGYLLDSKQLLRKELLALGAEALLSVPASRMYQELLN